MFEAYDVEAFQYLLKPVDDRKLRRILQKAVLKTKSRSREYIVVSRERQKKKDGGHGSGDRRGYDGE